MSCHLKPVYNYCGTKRNCLSDPRRDKAQTGRLGGHKSNKGYLVWSEPTEGLLCYKSQKTVMLVTRAMHHDTHTRCTALCDTLGSQCDKTNHILVYDQSGTL